MICTGIIIKIALVIYFTINLEIRTKNIEQDGVETLPGASETTQGPTEAQELSQQLIEERRRRIVKPILINPE